MWVSKMKDNGDAMNTSFVSLESGIFWSDGCLVKWRGVAFHQKDGRVWFDRFPSPCCAKRSPQIGTLWDCIGSEFASHFQGLN